MCRCSYVFCFNVIKRPGETRIIIRPIYRVIPFLLNRSCNLFFYWNNYCKIRPFFITLPLKVYIICLIICVKGVNFKCQVYSNLTDTGFRIVVSKRYLYIIYNDSVRYCIDIMNIIIYLI